MKNFFLFILILSLSFLKTQYVFSQIYNEHSIILEKGTPNYLYKDCENKIEIIIPEIEGDYLGLLVVSADAKVEQNKELPYVFSIFPNEHAEKVLLELYFYGNKIATKYFRLKPFPTPEVVLLSHNSIINSSIHRLPSNIEIQFSLGNFEDDFLKHENRYKADYYEIKLYRKEDVVFSTKTKETGFSSETISAIWQNAKKGDYLTIKAVGVKRKSADGKIHKLSQLKTLEIRFD